MSAIVGCGSSGGSLLSGAQADNLNRQLNRITAELDSRQCSQAQQDLQNFQTSIANMGGVNSTLISNLDQGAATVESLASNQCRTVVAPPKKIKTHTDTQTTQTFTSASTDTYTQPTYTTPSNTTTATTPGTVTTSTTGGGCLTCITSTTTATTTSTPANTTPSGGGGLGGATGASPGVTTTSSAGGSGF